VIDKFQKKTGVKVERRLRAARNRCQAVAALDSGTPPDVAYGDVFDFQVAGQVGRRGRLEDLSDILVPMKADFLPVTLETVYLLNEKTKKRAYYAFPMKRQTMHIQYWKDMLAEAGYKESTSRRPGTPTGTSGAPRLRRATARRPASASTRSARPWAWIPRTQFYSFLTYMDAYNVKVVDDEGKLTVDGPRARKS